MDPTSATFIVRLTATGNDAWSVVVERVKTGEKFRLDDLDAIGNLIARIVSGQDPDTVRAKP